MNFRAYGEFSRLKLQKYTSKGKYVFEEQWNIEMYSYVTTFIKK